MRYAWVATSGQLANYTSKLVSHWLDLHGSSEADSSDAEVLLASCSHPHEYGTLRRARGEADRRGVPLLVGGHEAYSGSGLLAWADYLCVGEVYRLAARLGGADWRDVLEAWPSVLTRSDPDRVVVPDYAVPWTRLPAIQTAKRAFYALAGRGCARKCRFCMTSWVQPHQTETGRWLERTAAQVRAAVKGAKVVYVTNDDGIGADAGSTTVKRFLEAPPSRKFPMVVRLGVEGLTESRRRSFKKVISQKQVAAAVHKAREIRRQLQLFYIVGFPDDPPDAAALDELAALIEVEEVRHPRVYMKFTYFEPSPHTPLARWDVSQLVPFRPRVALRPLRRLSGRYRTFEIARIGRAVWSTCARRLDRDVLDEWARSKARVERLSVAQACAEAVRIGGDDVVTGAGSYPWERVRCSVRKRDVEVYR